MKITNIKEIREDHDLNQKDVAKILGMRQQQYSRYENGTQSFPIEHLDKLANYYNTSIDYLVGRTDERKPYPKSILK